MGQKRDRGGVSRRGRVWLNANGMSMRRKGEIICKTGGEKFHLAGAEEGGPAGAVSFTAGVLQGLTCAGRLFYARKTA